MLQNLEKHRKNSSELIPSATSRWTARTVRHVNRQIYLFFNRFLLPPIETINDPKKSIPVKVNGKTWGVNRATGNGAMNGQIALASLFLQGTQVRTIDLTTLLPLGIQYFCLKLANSRSDFIWKLVKYSGILPLLQHHGSTVQPLQLLEERKCSPSKDGRF